jgi:DNA polymerase-1
MRIISTGNLRPDTPLTRNEKDWVYNGLDCCVTQEILEALLPQVDNIAGGTYAFSRDLQAPILEMAMRGLLVNQRRRGEVLQKFREQILTLSDQLTEIVREGVGVPVENKKEAGKLKLWWRSPAQLKNLLYDVMQLPIQRKRNAEGNMAPSTNRESIEKLSYHFYAEPICLHLLALRDLDKKRMFLETEIDPDGRMRSSFNIAGTNTGRLASSMSDFGSGTNLQNVDRDLRSIFIADPGMKFANLDLEQADARNLGALCWTNFRQSHGDAFAGAFLDLCESGDLHTSVCRMARPHLPWTGDPKADRAIADQLYYRNFSYRDLDKRLGHGSNYLGSPRTMAKHARVPTLEVETFQRNYFRNLPCIPEYHKYVRNEIQEYGQLTTLFGRRRFFFGRRKDDATIREAVAYSPQSMTAEEINKGMLEVWRADKVQLLVQVHDSILFQYPEELEDEIIPWALATLRIPLTLSGGRDFCVPTEAKVGWNWGDVSYNKDGTVKENPDGLIKWKGGDSRKRSDLNWTFSFRGL